jgi:hypothetical protein
MFEGRGPLQGKDWLRRLGAEDRKVFGELGLSYNRALHHLGGKARSAGAERDHRGRFLPRKVVLPATYTQLELIPIF